jgi:hypothetical protein
MSVGHLIRTLFTGYSQTVKSKEIKKFLLKCIHVADNQLSFWTSVFKEENLPVPLLSEIYITDAKEAGLSDRLILLHCTGVVSNIVIGFGISSVTTMRKDIVLKITKFTSDVMGLAKSGADLAVNAGWLERIPETADRKQLTH